MSQLIPLTKGKFATVDDDDYRWLVQWRWVYSAHGYAMRTYTNADGKRRFIQMHREIMDAKPGQLVDHIDGDRTNNRRSNLRIVTRSQNQWNRSPNGSVRSSPYKGVSKHARGWQARIRYHGRRVHLGYFDTPEEAARMYDAAALHLFEDFARLNFSGEPIAPDIRERVLRILAKHGLKAAAAQAA